MQNKAGGVINKSHWRQSTKPIYKELKLFKFQGVVKLQIAKLMHGACNNWLYEKYFKFSKLKDIYNYPTRGPSDLNYEQIQAKTEGKNPISFLGPRVCCEVTGDIKPLSAESFKHKYKVLLTSK